MKIRLYCIEDAKGDRAANFIAEASFPNGDIRRSFGKSPVEAFGYLILIHGRYLEILEGEISYVTEEKLSRHLYAEDVERKRMERLAICANRNPGESVSTEAKS